MLHAPEFGPSRGNGGRPIPQSRLLPKVLASMEEARPEDQHKPGAAVWLDERSEWQVLGIVRHDHGTVRFSDGALLVSSAGVSGLIRRKAWTKDSEVPATTVTLVRVTGRGRGHRVLDVQIHESSSVGGEPIELKNCRPAAALRALLEQVESANGSVKVEWVTPHDG